MKIFLKIFLALVVLLILGIAIFFLTFDLNSYKGMIADAASKALGRSVTITSMEMKLSLIPTIKVNGVQIENPEGLNTGKPFVTVDTIEATLSVVPLFSKKIEVRDFALGTVMLNLAEQNGRNNWTFGQSEKDKKRVEPVVSRQVNTADEWLSQMRIDSISAKALALSFSKNDVTQSFSITNVSVKQLKVFSLTLIYAGQSVRLSGTVNDILDFIKQKPDYLFNVEASALNMTVKMSGSIGDTKNFKNVLLNVTASGANLKQTLAQLKIQNAMIPSQSFELKTVLQGDLSMIKIGNTTFSIGGDKLKTDLLGQISDLSEGAPKITVTGGLTLTDATFGAVYGVKPFSSHFDVKVVDNLITLNNLSFLANRSDVQVKGRFSLETQKPEADLNINSEYFDVKDVLSETDVQPTYQRGSGQSVAASSGIFPDKTVDLSVLNQANARVSFNLPHLKISDDFSGYVGLVGELKLTNGILDVRPMKISLLNGDINGRIHAEAAQQPARITIQLSGTGLDLNQLKQLETVVRDATLDFSVDLSSQGNSVKTFLAALNGQIVLEIPQGTIVNKWFNTLPANMGIFKSKTSPVSFSTSDQESHIICGAVNLRVRNGEIKSDNNVAIETSTANFLVGGDVNLKTEQMNLTMIPSLNDAKESVNKALSAAQFVKITGTFSKPQAALNEKEIITSVAKAGVEKLIEKQLKKQGVETTKQPQTESAPYLLCQKVLGRQTIGQIKEAQNKTTRVVQPVSQPQPQPVSQPTKLSPQEEFKKQLMKSLSEVLQ